LLTTHYMDEAERLCDRVAVVDHGQVIALGSPRELIARLGGEHVVEFTLMDVNGQPALAPESLVSLPDVRSARRDAEQYCLSVAEPHIALPALLGRLQESGYQLASLTTRHAGLEDVFVTLTGRHLRDGDAAA
jgi:ABC-2 type transport system ATP-binding protein